jgi:hypothetical protein
MNIGSIVLVRSVERSRNLGTRSESKNSVGQNTIEALLITNTREGLTFIATCVELRVLFCFAIAVAEIVRKDSSSYEVSTN